MKSLIKYCVYRIAKFYKKTKWALDYVAQGYFILFFALTAYALTLLHVVLFLFNIQLDKVLIIIACVPLTIEVIFFKELFPNAQTDYNRLEREKLHEKYKLFKGVLIFLFLALSLFCFVFVSFTLRVE